MSAEAEEIMQDAYDAVARLEHQTLVAESTYQNLCLAAHTIRDYAQILRYELARASRKLNQYQTVTKSCNFAIKPWSPDAQPLDPRFPNTSGLFLSFERAQCLFVY